MADFVDIDSKQHRKEHFVYLGDTKIAVHPLGPDMSEYEYVDGITIYALRGWYYISHEDKAKADAMRNRPGTRATDRIDSNSKNHDSGSPELKPRGTRLGF